MIINLTKTLFSKNYENYKESVKKEVLQDLELASKKEYYFKIDEEVHKELGRFSRIEYFMNLILLYPFTETNKEIPFIFSDKDNVNDFFDNTIKYLVDKGFTRKVIGNLISNVLIELSDLACLINIKKGTTLSLYELKEIVNNNSRIKEIINTSFEAEQDFKQIQKKANALNNEIIAELKKTDNSFRELFNGKFINKNQFKQMFVNIGPKSDLSGQIIPELPNCNFLTGMRNIRDYFTMAVTARKILIISHKNVRMSGYLTRKLSLLACDENIDTSIKNCNTKNYVEISIDNIEMIKRLEGRYYKLNPKDSKLSLINEDSDILNKVIYLRSPITCKSKNICPICYGKLASVNAEYNVGILSVLELTSQLTQLLLSAKHILETDAPEYDFPEEFLNIFNVERNNIIVQDDCKNTIIFELEEDEETGEKFFERIIITNNRKSEKSFELPVPLYLTEDLSEDIKKYRMKDNEYKINLTKFNEENLFHIKIENKEITESLKQIQNLIEKKEHLGINNYSKMLEKFLELCIDNSINISSIDLEIIIRCLVRDINNLCERPDFNIRNPEYTILNVSEAILKSSSVAKSLSFQKINQQLNDVSTYKKDGYSLIEKLF
jgi:hypothetical protein